ncbi:MAG: hypothetical protein GY948_14575 [Alphaproteobacteria bacterium]|nr:hypothetical protein [Alphaproteobacteria bacterium]
MWWPRSALQYTEPMPLLALRYGLVVAITAVLFVVIRPPLPKSPMDWVHMSVVGILIQALYFGMCFLAFRAGVGVFIATRGR